MSIGELKGVANSPSDSDTTFIPFMLRYKPAHSIHKTSERASVDKPSEVTIY